MHSTMNPHSLSSTLEGVGRELGADLGEHLLARPEGQVEVEVGHPDPLVGRGAQPHLDPLVGLVPAGHVLEPGGIEVGTQLAVEHVEHVAVELGGHAGAVVVGVDQPGPVLDQVGTEEQAVVQGHDLAQLDEELAALGRVEVADGAAEEGEQPASRRAGSRSRCRWKSPTTALTATPGYSSDNAVAASHRVVSLTSRGTKRWSRPVDCMASSSRRDLSQVPAPSSTRVSAPGVPGRCPWHGRRGSSVRTGSGSTRGAG